MKKFSIIILIIALVVSVTGCPSNSDNEKTASTLSYVSRMIGLINMYPITERSANCWDTDNTLISSVTFSDPGLAGCIAGQYGTHVCEIKYLHCSYNGILDISGIENLTSLISLKLQYNNITDVSPLTSLTSLTYLYLNDNSIADVSPLASLTSLTVLELEDNNISDVSSLASLTLLTSLNLSENNISDLSSLTSLTSLTELDFTYNSITCASLFAIDDAIDSGDGDAAGVVVWGYCVP